jgi:uncharacterized protein YifN (PemK superfamily)
MAHDRQTLVTQEPVTRREVEGVEPLYDLRLAAALVPMTYDQLKSWLHRHSEQFPARYRIQRYPRTHRSSRVRLLYASEIKAIRKQVLRGAI